MQGTGRREIGMKQRDVTRERRFEALLHAHRKIVFKVASVYARSADDRHDLAQDIAIQLWRAFPSYDDSRRFSTWLYRVALNVGISFLRREQRLTAPLAPIDAFPGLAAMPADDDGDERLRALQALIDTLEPLNRALILLLLEERSYAEIADIVGISETNVATRISRIKQQLRTRLTAPADAHPNPKPDPKPNPTGARPDGTR